MSVKPKDVCINDIFGSTAYFIDFYQREYKWKKEHVQALLDDIFYRYDADYEPNRDATHAVIIENFQWYYMNSVMTNIYDGRTYIVDGQQRLTTLTLILIKLIKMADGYELTDLVKLLENKVFGVGLSGNTFWMGQNGRSDIISKLLDDPGKIKATGTVTEANMLSNYNEINKYLDTALDTKHKLHSFIIYFLTKVIFVNINIIDTTDVPMVFQVINDRGERLKPYEVFKGELLGQIDKAEIEHTYLEKWNRSMESLEFKGDEQPDSFFRYYFRSKHVDTEGEHRKFDGDYHRTVFSNDWDQKIKLKKRPQEVKTFISNELYYYSQLYNKLIDPKIYEQPYGEHVYYNYLNEQDRQYLLILSACTLNDSDELAKISLVSKLLDRHFVLLQLYGCYDSNFFTEISINLNKALRNQPIDIIQEVFDSQLLSNINDTKKTNLTGLFDYSLFKEANSSRGIRFIRYFFARIENFMAVGINPTHKLTQGQYWNLVRNTGHVSGYHVEHILANNQQNRSLFNDDEELFQRERNRLGALLILKGRDNISSGNELFTQKLKTYNNADISNRWNRSLIDTFYHTNKDFQTFAQNYNLTYKPYNIYDSSAIEERQYLLFEMVKHIWG
jgi:uncharacterized protein with ParB-like and HNH nuclease domain